MWLLNDFRELLSPPPARDLPPGRLELRKEALLAFVEADLRADGRRSWRIGMLRGLRAWLLTVGLVLLLAGIAAFGAARASAATASSGSVVETAVAIAAAPAVASLFVAVGHPVPARQRA